MKIYLEEITGFGTAVAKMYISLKTWTPKLARTIKEEEVAWRSYYELDNLDTIDTLCDVTNLLMSIDTLCDVTNLLMSTTTLSEGKLLSGANENLMFSAIKAARKQMFDNVFKPEFIECEDEALKKEHMMIKSFEERLEKLFKWGTEHITLLRFVEFAMMVDGLHRGGTDDFDSHAERFDNRIIRMSTRTPKLYTKDQTIEMSDYYKGKIILFHDFINKILPEAGVDAESVLPMSITIDDKKYVRSFGGYILESEQNKPDVLRGMIPLAISNIFGYESCITEFAHVVKMRGFDGHAHEELKVMIGGTTNLLSLIHPRFSGDLWLNIIQ